jgi:hypothetical protein
VSDTVLPSLTLRRCSAPSRYHRPYPLQRLSRTMNRINGYLNEPRPLLGDRWKSSVPLTKDERPWIRWPVTIFYKLPLALLGSTIPGTEAREVHTCQPPSEPHHRFGNLCHSCSHSERHGQCRSVAVIMDGGGRHRHFGPAGMARTRSVCPSSTSSRWQGGKCAKIGWGEELCESAHCLRV